LNIASFLNVSNNFDQFPIDKKFEILYLFGIFCKVEFLDKKMKVWNSVYGGEVFGKKKVSNWMFSFLFNSFGQKTT